MRPKLAFRVLLIAALAACSAACRKTERAQGYAGIVGGSIPMLQKEVLGASPPAEQVRSANAVVQAEPAVDVPEAHPPGTDARKLIRNGEISIEVHDFESSVRKATAIAAMYGGYVSDTQAAGEGSRRHGTVTIRVRSASFDQALGALKALGKVQTEHVGTEDITKAYTDLETRLRVKHDAAERIRDILKNRTARLSDVLAAEKELTALVEQIETMEGERRFYDQQVALSTISAEIHEPEAVTRPSAFDPLRQALRDSVFSLSSSLATFVTGILYLLPWVIGVAILVAIFRRVRARR
jgi:hypothetical protein